MRDYVHNTTIWSATVKDIRAIDLIVRPGANFIAATGFNPGSNLYFDLSTGQLIHNISSQLVMSFVELLDGYAAVTFVDYKIHVWNYETQTEVGVLADPTDGVHLYLHMILLNRKDCLAASDSNGKICFWKVAVDSSTSTLITNKWISCKQIHTASVKSMVNVDGGRLATGADNGIIKILNIDSALNNNLNMVLYTLTGHKSTIISLRFADSNQLVSAAMMGEVKVWNLGAVTRVGTLDWSFNATQGQLIRSFDIVEGGAKLMVCSTNKVMLFETATGQILYSTPVTTPVSGVVSVIYTPGISLYNFGLLFKNELFSRFFFQIINHHNYTLPRNFLFMKIKRPIDLHRRS
jgi:WD40 repeat protein